jgi:Aspartyl protease
MSGWGLAGAIASGFLLTATAAGASPAVAHGRLAARHDASLPCRPGFTTIRMTPLASGHHSVSIMLNGKPGIFLIDTGAGATIVHAPYLAKFALAPAAAAGIAANGGGKARYEPVSISALTVGGARTRLHQIYAMDLTYLVDAVSASSAQPIEGLIGQDVLRDQKAMIDFDQSVLYLADADPAAGAVCRPSGPAIASARSAP